ncbi:Sensor histidine kinase [Candidatus Magnetobacterium bavaricum]|uniref:diguanylate cyclase n=1 Tax=Candidatus Magnetobacterium bavaricum TaxID=29290 RepID=A0A0F3GWS1_9BACT|nr:Sensor histidine kinase [Candidatus Magnetobacterium bavaricum]
MNYEEMSNIDAENYNHAIQIGDRIWWVGHYMKGDTFQCHPYLIENGDQSVLIDPGSLVTYKQTLEKIEEIIPFSNIRYFVCHHQDPDITAALPTIEKLITRDDAVIVSHWRAVALLKHYDLKTPFWLIEEHDWKLDIGGRPLKFVYTPYLHFPGAFVTFDTKEGVLFSSDIFGGFTDKWSLFAKDERVFDGIRLFHEHYMPSREILIIGLTKLEALPIKMIAPQHGSIIPPHLVDFISSKLKGIDCGLYLLSENETDIHRLSLINKTLRDILETMIIYRDFHDIANAITEIARRVLPVASLEFFAIGTDNNIISLSPAHRYQMMQTTMSDEFKGIMGVDRKTWLVENPDFYKKIRQSTDDISLIIPLFEPAHQLANALAVFHLNRDVSITDDVLQMLKNIEVPMEVALEREFLYQKIDREKQMVYEQSIRDQLTGLYNRVYMKDTVNRLFDIYNREEKSNIAIVMFDIDHFKKVNDTFGHAAGDTVLRKVAEILLSNTRKGDLPIRLGGEEFVVFLIGLLPTTAIDVTERIRNRVSELTFDGDMKDHKITISAGLTIRKHKESLDDCLHKADVQLYCAKNSGRNRICVDI